ILMRIPANSRRRAGAIRYTRSITQIDNLLFRETLLDSFIDGKTANTRIKDANRLFIHLPFQAPSNNTPENRAVRVLVSDFNFMRRSYIYRIFRLQFGRLAYKPPIPCNTRLYIWIMRRVEPDDSTAPAETCYSHLLCVAIILSCPC